MPPIINSATKPALLLSPKSTRPLKPRWTADREKSGDLSRSPGLKVQESS